MGGGGWAAALPARCYGYRNQLPVEGGAMPAKGGDKQRQVRVVPP